MKSGTPWMKCEKRARIERYARAEAEWFYETLGGRVPADASSAEGAAARAIERSMKALASFHRGAFALQRTPREWPTSLVDEFDDLTSLVVRLECTQHPAVGTSDAELEAASVARLTARIADASQERTRRKAIGRSDREGPEEMQLSALTRRAYKHVGAAVRALAKARGDGPCLVPNWVDEGEEDDCE